VEFSVENRAAVKAKLNRVQKSLENVKKGKDEKIASTNATAELPVQEFSGAKADPKIKGLPSHRGPKIRHRKRPSPPDAEVVPSKKPKIRRKMFKNPENRKASAKKKEVNLGNTVIDKKLTLHCSCQGVAKTKSTKKKAAGSVTTGASKMAKVTSGKKGKWFDS
jgi:hypothetical protein